MSMSTALPSRPSLRRRSTAADPLKKVTLRLRTQVAEAVRSVVEAGDAPSSDAFVEDAIIAALRERRRVRLYAAYAEAAADPAFEHDMRDVTTAFDATLHDRVELDR
jgi:Arc/MetJ-type ribon-helix-helix transcriptional regulator